MQHSVSEIRYCGELFEAFYDVGSTREGGVTRLGYSAVEDEMHRRFEALARELGCGVFTDEVGNTFASNGEEGDYYLLGSHLDSVVDGGRYDGVAGVIAGLMVVRRLQEEGVRLPLRVAAFRCEESSNFGLCTIGSGLIAGQEKYSSDIGSLRSRDGERLDEIFQKRGLSFSPRKISGIKEYLELHIEQGKVLEETGTEIGIVSTIAGPRRFRFILRGMAEHSGATPMGLRNDALCAAAEVILAVERIGREEAVHQSVATVGVVENRPNVLNVIPGEVALGIDLRGIEEESLDRMEQALRSRAQDIAKSRGATCLEMKIGSVPPVAMSRRVQRGLERAASRLQISARNMPSGAGHDAMSFAALCDAGMVFIPCRRGVSHNRKEFASLSGICDGAAVICEYLKGEAV